MATVGDAPTDEDYARRVAEPNTTWMLPYPFTRIGPRAIGLAIFPAAALGATLAMSSAADVKNIVKHLLWIPRPVRALMCIVPMGLMTGDAWNRQWRFSFM